MQHKETTTDPLAKALRLLREKVGVGQTVQISAFGLKKGGNDFFVACVKVLINAGWCEYEFSDDYSGIKRLDLPDFAKDYFKKLENEYNENGVGSVSE